MKHTRELLAKLRGDPGQPLDREALVIELERAMNADHADHRKEISDMDREYQREIRDAVSEARYDERQEAEERGGW